MLTIISDIHITDETTSTNVAPQAFDILKNEIISSATENKVKEIRLIALGDIFDLMRTDYWLKIPKEERPWNGEIDLDTGMNSNKDKLENHFNKLLDNILNSQSAQAFIDMIKEIESKFSSDLPIYLNYVIGNHDRALNIFKSLQDKITCKIPNITFCNKYESDDYSILCRHGHEFDENNYSYELYKILQAKKGINIGIPNLFDENITKVMSIGEVITSELMSGLIYEVTQKGGDDNFVNLVKEINNVRPMTNVFVWLYWASQALKQENKEILIDSFRTCVNNVINSSFAQQWKGVAHGFWIFRADLVDRLKLLLDLVGHKDFSELSKYVSGYNVLHDMHDKFLQPKPDNLLEGAKSEFKSEQYMDKQYVFYGHTHEARNDYISGSINGTAKMYINTGTYLPYIQEAEHSNSFVSAYQMILCFLYRRDEDMDGTALNLFPTLDLWNGIKRKIYN